MTTPAAVARTRVVDIVKEAFPELSKGIITLPEAPETKPPRTMFCSKNMKSLDIELRAVDDSIKDMAAAMLGPMPGSNSIAKPHAHQR